MFGRKHGVSANGGSHHPSPNVQMVEIVLQIQFVLVRNPGFSGLSRHLKEGWENAAKWFNHFGCNKADAKSAVWLLKLRSAPSGASFTCFVLIEKNN